MKLKYILLIAVFTFGIIPNLVTQVSANDVLIDLDNSGEVCFEDGITQNISFYQNKTIYPIQGLKPSVINNIYRDSYKRFDSVGYIEYVLDMGLNQATHVPIKCNPDQDLKTGDVLLLKKGNKISYAALYLGRGYYLSKNHKNPIAKTWDSIATTGDYDTICKIYNLFKLRDPRK